MKTINASDFKARCLAILDEVGSTGEIVTVLKRGRPVAQVVPPIYTDDGYPQRELAGSVTILGDVVSPVFPPSVWDVENPS
jgi:prevent-host-death family protein